MCVRRHRDISAGAAEVFGVGCGSKSGTSFPRKLAAGFLSAYLHQGVVTTLRLGPRRNKGRGCCPAFHIGSSSRGNGELRG